MDPALLGTASAFGLAASAGLNTTLPLLCIGLLARFGLIQLASPYDALTSPLALGLLAVLAIGEFVGDKVPAVDSIVHALQWPLAAVAGAILFASQANLITRLSPEIALVVGLLTAAGVHGARTAARPVVTGTTLGTGNTALSIAEDGYALTLASTAALAPALGLVLLLLLIAVIAVTITLAVRTTRRLRGAAHNLTRRPAGP
jgi:hypothetical protein